MECSEQHLRELLVSMHAESAVKALLEHVERGGQLLVQRQVGSPLLLTNVADTRDYLTHQLGWRRKPDWTSMKSHAYVLSVCQRIESPFTLSEVVTRIAEERPEMEDGFGAAWGDLVMHKFIREVTPTLYEVEPDQQW